MENTGSRTLHKNTALGVGSFQSELTYLTTLNIILFNAFITQITKD